MSLNSLNICTAELYHFTSKLFKNQDSCLSITGMGKNYEKIPVNKRGNWIYFWGDVGLGLGGFSN